MNRRMGSLGGRQSGATAFEFALVFPLLVGILYSTIVYSYVYVLQQSINFAAQQGAQAALAVVPGTTGVTQYGQANTAVTNDLGWLPTAQLARVSVPAGAPDCLGAAGYFPVEVDFSLGTGANALFPALLSLFGAASFPPLPTTLIACASVQT